MRIHERVIGKFIDIKIEINSTDVQTHAIYTRHENLRKLINNWIDELHSRVKDFETAEVEELERVGK